MAELADALVSGTRARKGVQVQVLFPAPDKNPNFGYNSRFGFFISMTGLEPEKARAVNKMC